MNSQGRKPLFGDVLFLFALMAGVIFSWAGCSTTNPPSEPQPVAQSQKMEAGTKGLAKAAGFTIFELGTIATRQTCRHGCFESIERHLF